VSDLEMLIMLNLLQDVSAWQKDVKSRPQSITSKHVIQQDNFNHKKLAHQQNKLNLPLFPVKTYKVNKLAGQYTAHQLRSFVHIIPCYK